MFERDIFEDEVEKIVVDVLIIERYPNDQPFPSYLVLGFIKEIAVHIVYSKDDDNNVIVITTYKPNLKKWKPGYKVRRI
jgi:adenine deaminase